MKNTKRNNLYYFQRSTVIGLASIGFGKDVDAGIILLSHMYLEHASEKIFADFGKAKTN